MPPMSAPNAVKPPSKGDYASCPDLRHQPSHLHTGSSAHLGFPCLRTRIIIPRRLSTGSSAHLSVSCIQCRWSVSCYHLTLSAPCWPPLPPRLPDYHHLHSRASTKIPFSASISWASTTVCCRHGDRIRPLTLYPISRAHNSHPFVKLIDMFDSCLYITSFVELVFALVSFLISWSHTLPIVLSDTIKTFTLFCCYCLVEWMQWHPFQTAIMKWLS